MAQTEHDPSDLPIVEFVERQIEANPPYFVVYQRNLNPNIGLSEPRTNEPLLAFWPGALYPLLSDPEERLTGAVAIDPVRKELAYLEESTHLQRLRNQMWSRITNSYAVNLGFLETVQKFLDHGYKLYSAVFPRDNSPQVEAINEIGIGQLVARPIPPSA